MLNWRMLLEDIDMSLVYRHVHGASPQLATPSTTPSVCSATTKRSSVSSLSPFPQARCPADLVLKQEHHAMRPQPQPNNASVHDRHPTRRQTTPYPFPTIQPIPLFLVFCVHCVVLFFFPRSDRHHASYSRNPDSQSHHEIPSHPGDLCPNLFSPEALHILPRRTDAAGLTR
ncbi:hypothetical protein B0T18DRAFT_116330 [Schizothecium vesticola]|uniref:Uncharacterized protein n=1 Tax=Schizothecium vesticola TaxID=314040 RepID=A0AA40F2H8_9PEZI|nr:hypothetical protein B0T18DRAFT_116330 [Schizothecium vesticola]